MKKLLITLLTVFCLLLTTTASAEIGQAGQDLAILKAGLGARPLGMGGAFTAVADSADSTSWNPAGLGFIEQSEITTSQTRLSSDADHYYLSYVRPLAGGTLGISWVQIGLGSLVGTSKEVDVNNEVVDLSVFTYFSNAYLISYGKKVNELLSFGLTAKYLNQDMQVVGGQASGYSVTPGILLKLKNNWQLGARIDELFNHQQWATGTSERVPPKVCLGLAYVKSNPGVFALDVSQTLKSGYGAEGSVGYEWQREGLAFRTGYGTNGLSAGAGFTSGHTKVDYAFVTQASLTTSNVHRVSLSGVW